MADTTLNVTQSLDTAEKFIVLKDTATDGQFVIAVDGTDTNQPTVPVAADLVDGTRVSTAGVGDIINQGVTNYRSCTVQLTGTWAGTVQFQVSNDNSNWVSCLGTSIASTGTAGVFAVTANGLWVFSIPACGYFRVRWTTATSGTIVAAAYFSKESAAQLLQIAYVGGVVPGTAATSLGKAVDSAVGATDTGVAALVQRVTTPALITPVNNDYTRLTVDSYGKTWVRQRDSYGWGPSFTPMEETRAIRPHRLVGAQFDGTTVDPNFWTATVANSATIAQANAQIVLTSGTNAAASAQLNTLRRARYISGSSMRFRAVVQLGDTGTADNTRRWGIAWGATMPTITDGAYFQVAGTTFSIVTLKGSTPTTVNSGSFNGDVASYALTTSSATFEIYWTNSKVWYIIDGQLIHTVTASAATWAATMNHHVYMSNISSGSTTSVTLSCRVASIYTLGEMQTEAKSYYQAGTTAGVVLKYGPGNIHGIAVSGVVNNAAVTLYDNTAASGTIIWSSGAMGSNTVPFSIDLSNIPFATGLTIVIAAAACNATVMYE